MVHFASTFSPLSERLPDMRSAIVAALLLAAAPAFAQQTTLGYDAFVGGAKVGAAEVKIEKDDARYEISGKAWTVGVLSFVTQWQSMFSSTGRLADNGPVTDGYRFVERARDKVKELMLSGGQLTYVKNGQREVAAGTDQPRSAVGVVRVARLLVGRLRSAQRQGSVFAEADGPASRSPRRPTAQPNAARSRSATRTTNASTRRSGSDRSTA